MFHFFVFFREKVIFWKKTILLDFFEKFPEIFQKRGEYTSSICSYLKIIVNNIERSEIIHKIDFMERKALLIRGKDAGDDMSRHRAEEVFSICCLFLKFPCGGGWKDEEICKFDCSDPVQFQALRPALDRLATADYAFVIFLGSVCIKRTRLGEEYECLRLTDEVDWDVRKLELCSRVTVVMDCCRNCQTEPHFRLEEWMDAFGGSRGSHDEARAQFDQFIMDSEEGLIAIHAEETRQPMTGRDTFTHALVRSAVSWKNSLDGNESLLCVRDATLLARKYLEGECGSRHSLRYDTRNIVRHQHFPFAISY